MTCKAEASGARRLVSLLAIAEERLRSAGVEEARREARRVLGAVADVPAEAFLADPNRAVPADRAAKALAAIGERAAGKPLGRIVGEREFYGRSFALSPATLEPRPDTETIVDAVLERVARLGWQNRPLRIVDVGTGSGCLLIKLVAELPCASGLGIDIVEEAVAHARENAVRNGVDTRCAFACGNALDQIAESFDILVANPPYIRTGDLATLSREVRDHDPVMALDGGPDGLDVYRAIAHRLHCVVPPPGFAVFEIAADDAQRTITAIGAASGQEHGSWEVVKDLGGRERCVTNLALRPLSI